MQLVIHYTDPSPPTGVSVVTGTECNTADVSWSPSTVNYNAVIGNYSVRYRLKGSSGGYTTVYSPTTRITLQDLNPGAEYDVEVAAVDLCGRMSGFSEVAGLDLEGKFVSIHTYSHHSGMTSMQTTNTFVVHIAYNYNKQWPWVGYYMYPACMYVNCV